MNTKTTKSRQLEARMLEFALSVMSLTKKTPRTAENRIIIEQLVRSAASIGANYTEANNAISRQDFRNKIFIAKKEAAETRYWLRLLASANPYLDTNYLVGEVTELLLILQRVVTTLRNGQ